MKLIVAVDERWGIGRDNKLLFSIPEDMALFKKATAEKVVVMGRSTLLSLPGSRPLKNRINVVLTKDSSLKIDGAITCNSIEQLAGALAGFSSEDIFVIGGDSVYTQLLGYCSEAYVTKVNANGHADRFFPDLDSNKDWTLTEASALKTHDDISYQFCKYKNEAPLSIYEL